MKQLKTTIYADADAIAEGEGKDYETDFVSLVNHETYGPPTLVAPSRGEQPLARPGQDVLYVNTSLVPLFKIHRRPTTR
jgi:hypothetical protein